MVICKGLSEEVKGKQDCLSLEELQAGKWVCLKAPRWILEMRMWSALKKEKKTRSNIVIG